MKEDKPIIASSSLSAWVLIAADPPVASAFSNAVGRIKRNWKIDEQNAKNRVEKSHGRN